MNKGKILSYILRHDADAPFVSNGYVDIDYILKRLDISIDELNDIVDNDNKNRFSISSDKKYIRANQGHSVDLGIKYKSLTLDECPDILYHGTPNKNIDSIFKCGLVKMSRTHVHLSKDYQTAEIVAKRYKTDYTILEIDAKALLDKEKIYLSENGVYLCDYVSPIFIKK